MTAREVTLVDWHKHALDQIGCWEHAHRHPWPGTVLEAQVTLMMAAIEAERRNPERDANLGEDEVFAWCDIVQRNWPKLWEGK